MGVEMERIEYFREYQKPKKVYKKPENIHKTLTQGVVDYFKLRMISQDTLIRNGVTTDDKGNVVFNYYNQSNELTFIKYRPARKVGPKEMKSWRETDTQPILYGMNQCDPKYPLIIVEGEPDKLVLDECGIKNATSIPSGSSDLTWIEDCWTFMEQFEEIILWGDSDKAGREFIDTAIARLQDWKLKVVKSEEKDANVLLIKKGKQAIIDAVNSAVRITNQHITDLADVTRKDYKNQLALSTGFESLDELIGGFYPSELIVWTGWNGGGKSTFLSNVIINGIGSVKTFFFSGELPKEDFKEWMDLQVSGRKYLSSYKCSVKKIDIPIPNEKYYDAIDGFYRNNIMLYDSSDYATENNIIKAMEYAAKREGVKVFVIDNLMTVSLDSNDNEIAKITRFCDRLKSFARLFGATVHLVAHPKKPQFGQIRVNKYDIAGTSNITNLAHRVISIHRLKKEEKEGKNDKDTPNPDYKSKDTVLTVFKDRRFGAMDDELLFNFDYISKRFYSNQQELNKEYPWTKNVKTKVQEDLEEMPY
jgi:twinkle protein